MNKITFLSLKSMKFGFRMIALFCCLLLNVVFSYGQTNPAAFNLSGGSFSFTTQTATNTTYPTNVQGWNNGGTANLALPASITTASTADITMTASATASTAGIGNLGASGFQFLTTGTTNTVGAIAVSLNATGRSSLLVSWTAEDRTAAAARQTNLTLQYRVGTSGAFTTVAGGTYTSSATSQGAATTFTNVALPSACNNQAVVQLRWIYYESASQSGSRDAIRLDDITVSSSASAPTIDGAITAGEYGTHTNGNNQQSSASGTWLMSSDAANLYVALSGTNTAEGAVLYLDRNPISPVNGGTNADGNLVGYNYDGSSFANLQFRADLVIYFKDGYREYRTADGSGGWSAPTAAFGSYASASGTREIAIPWSVIGGQPASYNWFGYVAYSGGGAYASVPTENPGSAAGTIIGTSARWSRYYTVSTSTTAPFSRNSYTFTDASSITNFGAISVWDFTMNTPGLFLSRTGNVSGNWTIGGNLTVGNGIIYLGSGGTGYGTTSIAGNLNVSGGTFDMDATTGAVTVTGNVSISSGATLKLSTAVGGDLNVAGNWTNNGTFTPSSRLVQFNGSAAQTLTGASTFDFLRINNAAGLTLNNAITVTTNLNLTAGRISLGSNNLTMGSTATFSNQSATSYIATNGSGALIINSVGNTATAFPVGLIGSYTPLTVTNTGTVNNLALTVTSPPANAVSDAAKIINLEWNLNASGAGSLANVVFNWTAANQAASYTATGTGELGSFTSGPNYSVTNIGAMSGQTKTVNGLALSSGNNRLVLGNLYAVYVAAPANDLCANASTLTIDAAAVNGTLVGATVTSGNTFTYASTKTDVWYKFTPTATGSHTVTLNFTGAHDIDFDIFSASCPTTGTASQIAHGTGTTESVSASFTSGVTYFIRVIDYNNTMPTFTVGVVGPPAALSVSSTSLTFSTTQAPLTAGASQSFNLSGSQLTGAPGVITITAPSADFQVSNNDSSWGSSTTIAYSSSILSATPVYVRFIPQSSGTKTGNLTISGGGAASPPSVALSGSGVLPAPVATAATNITLAPAFTANWNAVTGAASGYLLDVSSSPTFGTSSPTTLTEGFAAGTTAPSGWTFTAINATYTSAGNFGAASPSLTMDATGDAVVTPLLSGAATQLSFWIKGNAVNAASALLVEGFNGTSWLTIQNITNTIPTSGTTYTYNSVSSPALPSNIVQFRFTYTKSNGNIGFDDLTINYNQVTPNFVTGYNAKAISGQSTITSIVDSNLVADTVYYYRLRATDGTPSSYSNVITVTPASRGGTLSGNQTICSGSQPSNLTLTGYYGDILRWESASDIGFTSPTTIANTTATLSGAAIGSLATTTYFRVVVQSGSNSPATSTIVTITVDAVTVGGSVSGGAAICPGSASGILTLTGHTGSVLRWESAVSPFDTWTSIANTTNTYAPGTVAQTTQFRAVLQNGSCAVVSSAATTVTVVTTTWNGTAWDNGAPTATTAAVIAGNFTSTTALTACSLIVTNNAVVTILSGHNVTLEGALTVNNGSTFTLENNANLLQYGTNNTNTGFIAVKRNSSLLKRLDYTLWSSPVAGQNLLNFSPQTIANRFYTYNSSTNFYESVASPSTTTFETAKGYLIRVPNNHPSITPTSWAGQFNGVPNNGNYSLAMQDDVAGQRFNLVGNPYPSPIDALAFIENANNSSSITGTLYFWRKTNGSANPSYCTWTAGGFVTNNDAQTFDPNDVIQTGQAFFVEATGTNDQLLFTNDMRVGNNANQFFRNGQTTTSVERNRIWLNASNATGAFSQTMIGYMTNASNGLDAQIDGKYINDGDIALTSLLDATPMAIQGRALPFDVADVVPMRFKATTAGTYNIAIDHTDGLFANGQTVFLRDNVTGVTHNLSDGAYTFAAEAGTFDSRFEVVYQSTLGTDTPVLTPNQVVVYTSDFATIAVNSGNVLMSAIKVFDVRGRLLTESNNINATQTTLLVNAANEVLLLQITAVSGETIIKKFVK